MALHDAVWYQVMQSALQRAYPSGLPSNMVLQQFGMVQDTVSALDEVALSLIQEGYSYGWGEMVATAGTGTYALTEPLSACWLLRLNAQIPSGDAVTLSAAIGSGTMQPIAVLDPAQTLVYADDLFSWSTASPLGLVGGAPWGAVSGWPDAGAQWLGPQNTAATSAPVGQWLLRKWVWFPSSQNYTFSFAADNLGALYLDGGSVISSSSYNTTVSATLQVTQGWHLLSLSCLNQGSTPKHTGVLLSVSDGSGHVVENGSYSPVIGATWQTTGFMNPTWTAVNSASDLRHSWHVIPASLITSESVSLQVSATGTPLINGVWWYSVAPWRWNQGGQYDASTASNTPAQVAPVVVTEVVG